MSLSKLGAAWRSCRLSTTATKSGEDRSIPPARPAPPELPEPGQHAAITDIFERYGQFNVVDLFNLDMFTGPWQELDWENRVEIPADHLQRHGRWLNDTFKFDPAPAACS